MRKRGNARARAKAKLRAKEQAKNVLLVGSIALSIFAVTHNITKEDKKVYITEEAISQSTNFENSGIAGTTQEKNTTNANTEENSSKNTSNQGIALLPNSLGTSEVSEPTDTKQMVEVPGITEEVPDNITKPETPAEPAKPTIPVETQKPTKPEETSKPTIPEKPVITTTPKPTSKPTPTSKPSTPSEPEQPQEPVVVADLEITADMLKANNQYYAVKNDVPYKTITIASDIENEARIALNGVNITEKLILKRTKENASKYQLEINNTSIPSIAMVMDESPVIALNDVAVYSVRRNAVRKAARSLPAFEGPVINLSNSRIATLNVNGNLQINGDATIDKLKIDSGDQIVINTLVNEINLLTKNKSNITINKKVGKLINNAKNSNITVNANIAELINEGTESSLILNATVAQLINAGRASNITLGEAGYVENLENNAEGTTIEGEGKINSIFINAGNISVEVVIEGIQKIADNIKDVFIKEFEAPTTTKVEFSRDEQNNVTLSIYDLSEEGNIYYLLNPSKEDLDNIKTTGITAKVNAGYNKIDISNLEKDKSYELYYIVEGKHNNKTELNGPLTIDAVIEEKDINIIYAKEEFTNAIVIKLNEQPNNKLKLENFSIIDKATSNEISLSNAKFVTKSDELTYMIKMQDGFKFENNSYILRLKLANGKTTEREFKKYSVTPIIENNIISRIDENTIEMTFTSDRAGKVYYGIDEDSNIPNEFKAILVGKYQKIKEGTNTITIKTSKDITENTKVWAVYQTEYTMNYSKVICYGNIPAYEEVEDPEEEEINENEDEELNENESEVEDENQGTDLDTTEPEDEESEETELEETESEDAEFEETEPDAEEAENKESEETDLDATEPEIEELDAEEPEEIEPDIDDNEANQSEGNVVEGTETIELAIGENVLGEVEPDIVGQGSLLNIE